MDINNLTSVYNQNPTLQGQYTLPQYLALFGQSPTTGTPPPVQITPTDPNAPTTPLNPGQGIINSGINQYQNDRPGEGANFATTPGNKYGLNKDTMRTEMVTVADGMGGTKLVEMTTAESAGGIRKDMKTGKNINHAGHDIETPLTLAVDFLSGKKYTDDDEFLEDGTIIGTFNNPNTKDLSAMQKFKADIALKKEQSLLTAELQKQKELKAQIERDRIRNESIARSEAAARGNYTPGGSHLSRGQSGGGLGLTQSQAQSVSQANKDAGYSSFSGLAKGGFVRGSYFDGGIVSLRRR